ncbi:DUF7521 family protein [Natronorarus salvus]|uniref:DUF7521 family protein n=1 Tax=Natronorarus salvus TaxID=3117733 RepID=UPI002F26BA89
MGYELAGPGVAMTDVSAVIVAANTVTLVVGGAITLFALRAYRRTGLTELRALAFGLGLVASGALVGGLLHQVAAAPLLQGIAIQSTLTAIGFLALGYSLAAKTATGGALTVTPR